MSATAMPADLLEGATVREAVRRIDGLFDQAGCATPRLDAEMIVAHALGTDRAGLVRDSNSVIPVGAQERLAELVGRRCRREPVAYIVGTRRFRRIELVVDARVLVPRPETELLVEWALDLPERAKVADVGTGSGAIALALADERPDLDVVAIDSDPAALAVASANASRLGLDLAFAVGDLLEPLTPSSPDAVVANLPYVPAGELEALEPEVRLFEPRQALTAGPEGLELVQRLVRECASREVERIALEVGAGQAGRTRDLVAAAGWQSVEVLDDLAGIGRVVTGSGRGGVVRR